MFPQHGKISEPPIPDRLGKILAPYRIGRFQAAAPSMAAQMWPDVEAKMLQLRLEDADGTLLQVTGLKQLRLKVQGVQ